MHHDVLIQTAYGRDEIVASAPTKEAAEVLSERWPGARVAPADPEKTPPDPAWTNDKVALPRGGR